MGVGRPEIVLGGQALLALEELPGRPGVWKMTLEGQVRWQSERVLGQGNQGVQAGAAGTLAEGPSCGAAGKHTAY